VSLEINLGIQMWFHCGNSVLPLQAMQANQYFEGDQGRVIDGPAVDTSKQNYQSLEEEDDEDEEEDNDNENLPEAQSGVGVIDDSEVHEGLRTHFPLSFGKQESKQTPLEAIHSKTKRSEAPINKLDKASIPGYHLCALQAIVPSLPNNMPNLICKD
jgi:hypothetical protein